MSQSSADRLISRINALHKSLQLDEGGKPSAMERDLMLGYLRELYELYAVGGAVRVGSPAPAPKPAPVPSPTPAPPAYTPPPPNPAPAVEVQRPVAPQPAPPKPTPAPAAAPPPPPAPVAEVPRPVPPAPAAAPQVVTAASGPIRELFTEDPHGNPFGRQPLKDLTRSLTINNRALFTRDLFGGDNDLLNTTLRTLNTSGSEAAARPVLESLARRFDWTEEAKKETAREFIELVRRRYA